MLTRDGWHFGADFIGKIIVPIGALTDEQERNEWYKLQPRGEDEDEPVGDIKLQLTFDAEQQQLSINGTCTL